MAGRRNTRLMGIAGGQPSGGSSGGSSKYDETEFLVGGKGALPGDTEKQSFRVHQGYIVEAIKILQGGKFPYETLSDLYRHAVVRHIPWLFEIEPELEGGVLYELKQIDAIVARTEFQLKFQKSIDSIAKMIRDTMSIPGGEVEASRILRAMRKHINKMRPGFFKSHYEHLFNREFSKYEKDPRMVLLEARDEGDGDADSPLWNAMMPDLGDGDADLDQQDFGDGDGGGDEG